MDTTPLPKRPFPDHRRRPSGRRGPRRSRSVCGIVLAVVAASCSIARADGAVVRTLVLETEDVAAYRAALDEGRRIMAAIGVVPAIRVEPVDVERAADRADRDGPTVLRVVAEYPDSATRERWAGLLEASDAYATWLGSLDGLRRIVADDERTIGARAPLLTNIGDHHRPISTGSRLAQRYFDQGLRLYYGFYYPEAVSSFREAIDADPTSAAAWWGLALAIGPNPNARYFGATDDPRGVGLEAIRRAVELGDGATPRERALIDALVERFDPVARPDRDDRDRAYAFAMRALHEAYPGDADIATLYAEACMTRTPWRYWNPDGSPRIGVLEAERALRHAMAIDRAHPGAHHFFVHLMESSPDPEEAMSSARALETLMPDSGHMVHMPSHIYIRVGRYADAARSNLASIDADGRLTGEWGDRELPLDVPTYRMNARGHHDHARAFLHMAAVRQGNFGHALDALLPVTGTRTPEPEAFESGRVRQAAARLWTTYRRFGRWEDILEIPTVPEEHVFLRGFRHYARGFARLADGELDAASEELGALEAAAESAPKQGGLVPPADLLVIAAHELAGLLAERRGDVEGAIARLETAVRLEDGLPYREPPAWLHPVRHALGHVLLRAGTPGEAETVFWEDLRRNPENGRSLHGLARSLVALGETERAARIEERFRRAWSGADVPVESGEVGGVP